MGLIEKWALDPGSDTLRIQWEGREDITVFPACGVFDEKGRAVALGNEALEAEDRLPMGLRWSRPFSGGVILQEEDAAAVLIGALRCAAQSLPGRTLAVAALPANLTQVQLSVWNRVLARCGVEKFLWQPSENALAAAADTTSGCVVDMGSLHTQITVFENERPIYAAGLDSGLRMWDEALIRFFRTRHHMVIGKPTAAWIRTRLGCAIPRKEIWRSHYTGVDLIEGLPQRHAVDSDTVHKALFEEIGSWCDDITGCIQSHIGEEDTVLLVGGGASLYGMADRLSEACGHRVFIPADPGNWKLRGLCRIAGFEAVENKDENVKGENNA